MLCESLDRAMQALSRGCGLLTVNCQMCAVCCQLPKGSQPTTVQCVCDAARQHHFHKWSVMVDLW
jgi:hypothetical protein